MHAGVKFLEHLQGVQRVLESWGEPNAVSLAGLFHSIYGTELFQVTLHMGSPVPAAFAIAGATPFRCPFEGSEMLCTCRTTPSPLTGGQRFAMSLGSAQRPLCTLFAS